eukprot:Blabericola_migrator_1__8422@NODE_438_length_8472_cov_502_790006_g344_i0_p6_GENE_NODE_438_length_8472_cov_502_790006_g344_i0NODE_438_length_8472_cov_502_790006_g344_i0_p6_ORF_typecomplete_len197_score19_71_NODE_438_length_8472_cov_502_790006_g344_i023492939
MTCPRSVAVTRPVEWGASGLSVITVLTCIPKVAIDGYGEEAAASGSPAADFAQSTEEDSGSHNGAAWLFKSVMDTLGSLDPRNMDGETLRRTLYACLTSSFASQLLNFASLAESASLGALVNDTDNTSEWLEQLSNGSNLTDMTDHAVTSQTQLLQSPFYIALGATGATAALLSMFVCLTNRCCKPQVSDLLSSIP